MTDAEKINALICAKSADTIALSEKIWNFAEPNWREAQSAKAMSDALCAEGFAIEHMPCGMQTAFVASFTSGTGGPVIVYVGEYDALSGLSQEAGMPQHLPLADEKYGHGCGHNLLGAGSFAAAVALKDYAVETGLPLTVKCFGCPAEEDGGGKVFFARGGYFNDADAVFAWHPGSANLVSGQGCLAISGVLYTFKGRTAHAACTPFAGRSALDAAELMSVGCNYLREHIIPEARLHYAYRDAGGTAPNVVQERTCVHYFIRAPKVAQMLAIKERVADVARGAALMTGTDLTVTEVDGFCDYVPNRTLSELLCECMQIIGAPAFDAADEALAAAFAQTVSTVEREDNLATVCKAINVPLAHFKDKVLDTTIPAFVYQPNTAEMGSTDVGDVSYCAPTAQCNYATMALGTGAHTWQMTAQSNATIGTKGMLQAAKALALAGVRAAQNPALLAKAKEEHARNCPEGYRCCLSADAVPGPIL